MTNQEQKARHTKIIGNIFIVFGSLTLIAALIAFNLIDFIQYTFLVDEVEIIDLGLFRIEEPMKLLYFLPLFVAFVGATKLVAGLGIINKIIWAETLSLVLAFFMLFNMPFGTGFAVYIFYTFIGLKDKAESINEEVEQA
jgi:hypothetical protein